MSVVFEPEFPDIGADAEIPVPIYFLEVDLMIKRSMSLLLCVGVCTLFSTTAHGASTTVVGFDGGSDDGFTGNAVFEPTGGNPDGNAHHVPVGNFFSEIRTGGVNEPANANFLGDYSSFGEVTFSFDVKTESLTDFIGNQIARPVGIKLTDRDIQGGSGPSGVYFEIGALGVNFNPDWTTLSVTIDDPTSSTLPAGWIGFGDEDPNTFAPILPAGATFATVLAGVDEFAISGAVPGFFFNNAFYDVRIDNVAVTVPEPGSWMLVLSGLLALVLRRR